MADKVLEGISLANYGQVEPELKSAFQKYKEEYQMTGMLKLANDIHSQTTRDLLGEQQATNAQVMRTAESQSSQQSQQSTVAAAAKMTGVGTKIDTRA